MPGPFKNLKPTTTAFYGPGQNQPQAINYTPGASSLPTPVPNVAQQEKVKTPPRPIPPTQSPVVGPAASTRAEYETQNRRLYSGGVGFGFGKPAPSGGNLPLSSRIVRPQPKYNLVQREPNANIQQLRATMPKPDLRDPANIPMEGPVITGDEPVQSSTEKPTYGKTSRAVSAEEPAEEPKTAADVWNMDGAPPKDGNEFARRLRREYERTGNEAFLLTARRIEKLMNTGYFEFRGDGSIMDGDEYQGNLDDPDSWSEAVRERLSDGDVDEPGPNNLLETGTESWDSFKSGPNYGSLPPEQKAFAEWAQENGIAIDDDTGRMYDHGKMIGSIYEPTTYEGKAKQGWDAIQKKTREEETQKFQEEFLGQLSDLKPQNISADELIRTMRLRRAQEDALNLRAAMEGGARAGVSPEGAQGIMSNLAARSAVAGEQQEAQTQLQTQMFNAQQQMDHYRIRAQALMQLANMQQDERMRRQAFDQAMEAQYAAQKWQEHMYQLQQQVTGKDLINALGGGLGQLGGMFLGPLLFPGAPAASAPAAPNWAAMTGGY